MDGKKQEYNKLATLKLYAHVHTMCEDLQH